MDEPPKGPGNGKRVRCISKEVYPQAILANALDNSEEIESLVLIVTWKGEPTTHTTHWSSQKTSSLAIAALLAEELAKQQVLDEWTS